MNSSVKRSSSNANRPLAQENFLFFLAIFCQIVIYAYLIIKHRIPGGHDGFQYFHLQYYFLNDKVISNEVPYWIPYMTHGTVSTWWYAIQASFFQSALIQMSFLNSILKNINFTTIFNVGMFVDELVLLIGTWLLSKRYYKSPLTVFFVSITVLGSCIWMVQPWYNCHFYFALPLILYFYHKFLDTSFWRYFLLATNLLAIQTLGNLPYFIPVSSLFIFLYFLIYTCFEFMKVRLFFKSLQWNWQALISIVVSGLSFYFVYEIMMVNTDQIVNYNYGRSLTGTTSLEGFLTYGRNFDLSKWAELLIGISPFLDQTLFFGYLPLAVIPIALFFNRERLNYVFLIFIVIIMLFSMSTPVTSLFYYIWPKLNFFRHLALTSSTIKLFMCFLAGFGFDTLLQLIQKEKLKTAFSNTVTFIALLLLGVSIFLFTLSTDADLSIKFMDGLVEQSNYVFDEESGINTLVPGLPQFFEPAKLAGQFRESAVYCLITSFLLIGLSNFRSQNKRVMTIAILLAFHTFHIFNYKLNQINQKTVALHGEYYKATEFQNIYFDKNRHLGISLDKPRDGFIHILRFHPIYWSTNIFIFKDEIGHSLRCDHWLKPLDLIMRAYWGQGLEDYSELPKGLSQYNYLIFPLTHPASRKITGLEEDKIQFFSKAYKLNDADSLGSVMTKDDYAGDLLFLLDKSEDSNQKIETWQNQQPLSDDTRLKLNYKIDHYDSNNLIVSTEVPLNQEAWLMYSDIWHPLWQATINGQSALVYQANLAYKAVGLKSGPNKIHFSFKAKKMANLVKWWGINSILWLGIIFYFTYLLLIGRQRKD